MKHALRFTLLCWEEGLRAFVFVEYYSWRLRGSHDLRVGIVCVASEVGDHQ